jgi:hypothetical protein
MELTNQQIFALVVAEKTGEACIGEGITVRRDAAEALAEQGLIAWTSWCDFVTTQAGRAELEKHRGCAEALWQRHHDLCMSTDDYQKRMERLRTELFR